MSRLQSYQCFKLLSIPKQGVELKAKVKPNYVNCLEILGNVSSLY